jgi:hypothetical protein
LGPLERAFEEIVSIAAQYQVQATDEAVARATAEIMSCAANTIAAQRAGKVRKADFFLLHMSTSAFSIYVLLQETWIQIEDKARLLDWKGRLDLLWYAGNGSSELNLKYTRDYQRSLSEGMDWCTLYTMVNDLHDDGHVVKLVRALKLGESVVKAYEQEKNSVDFPVTGELWFKMPKCAMTLRLALRIWLIHRQNGFMVQGLIWHGRGFQMRRRHEAIMVGSVNA